MEVITLPKVYSTDVLTQDQLEFVAQYLPQPKAQTGRPAYTNLELLGGILKVLRSGSRWRDLDLPGYISGVTHWRRLRFWQQKDGIEDLFLYILKLLFDEGKLELSTTSIDGSLLQSFAFSDLTQYSGKYHKTGTKVSLVVEGQGIPLSHLIAMGACHDAPLAIPTILKIPLTILLEINRMLGDKGYDDTKLWNFLKSLLIEPDIPQRELPIPWQEKVLLASSGKHKPRDQTSNYLRFVVERTNAWIKSFRRLRFRYDYTTVSFEGFLTLAFVVICVRKLIN